MLLKEKFYWKFTTRKLQIILGVPYARDRVSKTMGICAGKNFVSPLGRVI